MISDTRSVSWVSKLNEPLPSFLSLSLIPKLQTLLLISVYPRLFFFIVVWNIHSYFASLRKETELGLSHRIITVGVSCYVLLLPLCSFCFFQCDPHLKEPKMVTEVNIRVRFKCRHVLWYLSTPVIIMLIQRSSRRQESVSEFFLMPYLKQKKLYTMLSRPATLSFFALTFTWALFTFWMTVVLNKQHRHRVRSRDTVTLMQLTFTFAVHT